MKLRRLQLYLLDALCCTLFALATAQTVFPALGHSLDTLQFLPLIFLLILFYSLGLVRIWLPFILLALVSFSLIIVSYLSGQWDVVAAYAAGYFPWCFSGMANIPPYDGTFSRYLAYLLLLVPIVLVFWLALRRFFSIWFFTLLSVILVAYQSIASDLDPIPTLLLLCSALIICLPRARLANNGRLRAQLLALLFVFPILGASLYFAPDKDGEWTSVHIQHFVHDIQDFWEYHWGPLPQFPITSMRHMGWMPQGDRLGGDIEIEEKTIFTIETSDPFLLRGEVLDYYTGSSWQNTPEENYGNFRMTSLLWQNQRRDAFGLSLPSPAPDSILGPLTNRIDAKIRCASGFQTLFLPYRLSSVSVSTRQNDLYFNYQGETVLEYDPDYAYTYQVQADAWNPYDSAFDRYMIQLEQNVDPHKDSNYENIRRLCLQLPESLPSWVADLCHDITDGLASPYEKAMALRDYLTQNCTYTLTPGSPDPDLDFVADFLQKKQGYCVYFASALTVMCRLEGIPARYVTGYGMIPGDTSSAYIATQATAHAWTEIYLGQIGWVPIDSLSQSVFLYNTPVPEEPTVLPPAVHESEPELPIEEAPTDLPSPETDSSDSQYSYQKILWLLPILLLFLLLLYIGMTFYPHRYRASYVQKRYLSNDQAAEYYYHDLLRQLRLLGILAQGGDTLLTLGQEADRRLPSDLGISIASISQIMNHLRFGGYSPTDAQIQQMEQTHSILETYLRKLFGFWGYFFKRFLGALLFNS